jgi:uncharacterized protein
MALQKAPISQELLNARPTTKQKALFAAIKDGRRQEAMQLVAAGVGVNFACPFQRGYALMTPLMLASFKCSPEIVKRLASRGGNIDVAVEPTGYTALCYALQSTAPAEGVADIVAFLLEHGANPNRLIDDAYGTLLCAGIRKGGVTAVKLLLDKGAATAAANAKASPLIRAATVGDAAITLELLNRGAELDYQSQNGRTALMEAADRGHPDLVTALIAREANVNLRDRKGETALTLAANRMGDCFDEDLGGRYLRIVRFLVEAGADKDAVAPNGWTPLDFAEFNPMADREASNRQWFSKGAEYLRSVGAKRKSELQ